MRAKYTPKEAQIRLDKSETIIIARALDSLRYGKEADRLTGSQLLDLAALSTAWMCMCQDMNSPKAAERCEKHNEEEAARDMLAAKPSPEEALNITYDFCSYGERREDV